VEGHKRTNPKRGGSTGPARAESSEGGAKSKKAIASNNQLDVWNVTGEDLEGQPGDG